MVLESNRELVLRRLTECLARDRTKHQVAEVTSLGLVQMTRKRVGEGLLEAFSDVCDCCKGRGVIIHTEPVDKPGPAHDEERAPGKGKRRRGRGSAAAAEPDELPPAASDEQRRAATAAIAAIHRAAAGETGADDHVIELATDLVEAVAGADAEPVEVADAGDEMAEDVPDAVDQGVVPDPSDDGVVPDPSDEGVAPDDDAPAPRRRRRVASRPAGPPGAA
jgi:ribonuclease E